MKKKLVVLSGAGVSAESGISTFRDSNGLWDQYKVEDVASIEGWIKNPGLVLDFYNQRRLQLATVKPNAAHYALADLEKDWDAYVNDLYDMGLQTIIDNYQAALERYNAG